VSGTGDNRATEEASYGEALRLLARRPCTVEEIRQRLSAKGHGAASIEATISRLLSDGHLDDGKLALHYILARAERLGHGRERLLRELGQRGVAGDVARAAWRQATEDHALEPGELLSRQVRRRVEACGGSLDRRDYRRVYNALFRAGHDADRIAAALAPYRAFSDSGDDDIADGTDR
jgi:SOS response regulatory protein OraA/RecX